MMRIEVKNLVGVSLAIFLSCGAFTAVYSLESTLHKTDGLASFSLLFVGHAVLCLFAPAIVSKCGTKNCIAFGILCWIVYIGCNLYPKWYILLPVSVLVGLGSTPLWIAAATHLTSSAIQLAKSKPGIQQEALINQFIGVYFLAQLFSTIPGNLISSLVLFQGTSKINGNQSSLSCGSQDCGDNGEEAEIHIDIIVTIKNNTNIDHSGYDHPMVDPKIATILFCALASCCFVGLVISLVATDSLHSFCDDIPERQHSFKDIFRMTFKIFTSLNFILIVPLIALNGFELGFLYGIFTKSFVSCTLGVQTIGLVMTVGGIGGALFAVSGGGLIKFTGRIPIASFCFLSQIILIPCMIVWSPDRVYDNNWQLYIMSFMWSGIATLRSSQITSLLGVLHPRHQEAAYGCHLFFHFLFYALPTTLRIPKQICTRHLLQAMLGLLVLAGLTYYILEWIVRRTRHNHDNSEDTNNKFQMVSNSDSHISQLPNDCSTKRYRIVSDDCENL